MLILQQVWIHWDWTDFTLFLHNALRLSRFLLSCLTPTFLQVLQPAIELAEDGFPVAPVTAYHWAATSMELRGPGRAAFLNPDGDPPNAGEIQRNPDLGRTFRSVAEHGALEGGVGVFVCFTPKAAHRPAHADRSLLKDCIATAGGPPGHNTER